jgi:hypothetical protein
MPSIVLGTDTPATSVTGSEKLTTGAASTVTTEQIAQYADAVGVRANAIPSATTTDIGAAAGGFVHITGTTAITSFGTVQAGTRRFVVFDASLTLTHNATSLILPGGVNIVTQANDAAIFVSEGSGNWRCLHYAKASGQGLSRGVALTDAATVNVDASLSDNFRLTLGGNRTLANPTNLRDGQVINIRLIQDGTGGRTLAYGSKYKFPGGTAPVLSTAASARDFMSCQYDATADTLFCVLNKDFK